MVVESCFLVDSNQIKMAHSKKSVKWATQFFDHFNTFSTNSFRGYLKVLFFLLKKKKKTFHPTETCPKSQMTFLRQSK